MSPTSPIISSIQYPLQNPSTEGVFQSIVKGRKSWKTLKGGEVVWPPELEAALIEGLENYQPDDSRETRLLGRFPMRNKFISDWIFEKTGKRRTAKQVGSRLQQLRDSCKGRGKKSILTLLSPFQRPSTSSKSHHRRSPKCESDSGSDSSSSSSSSASTPATPIEDHATLQSLLYRGVESREEGPSNIIFIDLLRPGSSIDVEDPTWTSPAQLAEERLLAERGYRIIRATQHPRLLQDIDPTITFLAHSMTNARCRFTVYCEDRVVFTESTTLQVVETTSNVDGILYKTPLVPGFWDTISKSSDASQYTITQQVVQDTSSTSTPSTIFSAIFKFIYQTSTPTIENFAIAEHLLAAAPTPTAFNTDDFSLETLLTMEDAYNDMMALHDGTVKSSDWFDWDFASPDWSSSQSSPDQSVFSSPAAQLVPSDEEMLVLSPSSSFGIDIANYI